tara:strand:+ start:5223 stop:5804 length:582 start_codon:yes stop_codon:yes gene_type:complete
MNITDVPSDWAATGDKLPVSNWLADDKLPIDRSAEEMIQYLKGHYSSDFGHMIHSTGSIPQDFVHWWCYMGKAHFEEDHRTIYPTLKLWLPIVSKWLGRQARPSDIFGTFKAWLDILFLDQTVYDNEDVRPNVPRKYAGQVYWMKQPSEKKPQTRLDTMQYIIQQGFEIFSERGWSEGYKYWQYETKNYELFA